MLGHFIPRAGHHERGQGRNVKGVLAIAAGAAQVDDLVGAQTRIDTQFQHGVPEAFQFMDGDIAHQENGQESGHLAVVKTALG